MCVEAEGCSEDTYSSVGGGNFRGVCPCRGVLSVKETGLSGDEPDRLRYLGGRNAGTNKRATENRDCLGLGPAYDSRYAFPKRPHPAGLHAEGRKFRISFTPSEETPG